MLERLERYCEFDLVDFGERGIRIAPQDLEGRSTRGGYEEDLGEAGRCRVGSALLMQTDRR